MKFISYAQNNEDVLLWRALGHITHGFYIDVGANDPVEHSVTKAFYDAGWRGINIEPLPVFQQAFQRQRPHDVNLAIAAGERDGSLTLYDVPAVNGWASPDPDVAAAHQADGHVVNPLTVPVRTLAGICREHARAEIHFLKIDVEGFEAEVLRGMDFEHFRPWLLVIEATLPNSQVTNHAAWESLVTGKGYSFAWFDGLNRYYVSHQHPELMAALTVQPNVFDNFISYHLEYAWRASAAAQVRVDQLSKLEWQAEQRAERAIGLSAQALENAAALLLKYDDANLRAAQANTKLARVRINIATLRATVARLDASAAAHAQALNEQQTRLQREIAHIWTQSEAAQAWGRDLEQRLLALLASRSWRITAPWRSVGARLKGWRSASLLRRVVTRITANERARRLLIPLMLRYPALGQRVAQTVSTIKQAPMPAAAPDMAVPEEMKALPVSARKVLGDLQRALRHDLNH